MKKINIEEIILSMLSGTAKPGNEEQMLETINQGFDKSITGMVFLPSGNGFLMSEEDENELS